MFDTNYYCLVAGLREYSLDGGAKGFDPHAILDEILRELTPRDLRAVRLLYGYYDCKNLIALRAGSPAHDPLGNFARERLKEETEHPRLLPHAIGLVLAAYARPDGEEDDDGNTVHNFYILVADQNMLPDEYGDPYPVAFPCHALNCD